MNLAVQKFHTPFCSTKGLLVRVTDNLTGSKKRERLEIGTHVVAVGEKYLPKESFELC